ncbi:type II toxin-antitoxin system RelE/ParE family toxin [Flavobacterium restrictum]|uniref:Type II toxin-antitoxin system RelE/ParE family toxin n=1 Tax=Flavobacterium restrictum TaxID=2594428 RepID=A0A553E8H7_9FLAO|nr:type II toxin-antitoxin system RelE/ParE family toxin [Flavobacterium restrictum]TRX41359.1 type II toxin-antitoxin system RelE/ParE family toxin [Flavobacterium restrictum]
MVRGTRRKIVWTSFARASRASIFAYWNKRNKSTLYSKKLNVLFQESLQLLLTFPESSIKSSNQNVRLKIASHFEIIYSVSDTQILVLDIWDTRQNPSHYPVK